jgi:hypothetical protein
MSSLRTRRATTKANAGTPDHQDGCHQQRGANIAQIGCGEFAPPLQANREEQKDCKDADHRLWDFQIRFDQGGNNAQQKGECDGRDQVLDQDGTVHCGSPAEVSGVSALQLLKVETQKSDMI